MTKRILAFLLAGALLFATTGCTGTAAGSSSAQSAQQQAGTQAGQEQGTIGLCIEPTDDLFWADYYSELQTLLQNKGYTLLVQQNESGSATQAEQIKACAEQGAGAVIVNLTPSTDTAKVVTALKNAALPAVLVGQEPTRELMESYDRMVYVGASGVQAGTLQGELVLGTPTKGDLNGDGVISYVMIQGDAEDVGTKLSTEYSIKALLDAGFKADQLAMQAAGWDADFAKQICAAALQQYGPQVEVVLCGNDTVAMGALQAIQEAGRTVGSDIYLVGTGAMSDALAKIQDGQMTGTVYHDPAQQAEKTAELLKKALKGNTFSKDEQKVYVDDTKIDADNVAQYLH